MVSDLRPIQPKGQQAHGGRGRRTSVSAECVDPDNLEVRSIDKTGSEMARLEECLSKVECNLFFMKSISPDQRDAVRGAMEERRIPGKYNKNLVQFK